MENRCLKFHLRGHVRVFVRESEGCTKKPTYSLSDKFRVNMANSKIHFRSNKYGTIAAYPTEELKLTSIELAVIRDHEHDLPLEYVIRH